MKRSSIPLLGALFALTAPFPLFAEDWPQWRGPRGDGTSPEKGLPAKWSKSENVLWRLPLPGPGGSTPIVLQGKIFLTSAHDDDILLLAVGTDGKEIWRKKIGSGNRAFRGDEGNMASASPSTDGERVYATSGAGLLLAHDLDGKEIWRVDLQAKYGKYRIQFGMASTPALHEGALYIQCFHQADHYLLALDAKSGAERWKVDRKTDARHECLDSYASTIVYRDGAKSLLLAHGGDYLTAHRLEDGGEVFRCGGLNPKSNYNDTLRFVASPCATAGLIVVPSAKNGPVLALRPDGAGDVTESARIWEMKENTPDVPTPAIDDGLVYLLRENGVLMVLDAKSGERLYRERTHDQRHRASPVVADGKVYCASTDGTVSVARAGRKFELLGTCTVDEHLSSTPVVAGGRLYLRSYEALYAIRAPQENGTGKPAAGGGGE